MEQDLLCGGQLGANVEAEAGRRRGSGPGMGGDSDSMVRLKEVWEKPLLKKGACGFPVNFTFACLMLCPDILGKVITI